VDLLGGPLKKDNPTVIELYNRQLVEGVIAFRNAQVMFGNPDGLGADGRGEDEIEAEKVVKERVNQIFKDLARRNAGGEGNPTPEEFESKYTTGLWLWTVKEVMRKDEKQGGINFYDHDYWTFSQDPSPDIKVQKIDVDEIEEDRATVFVRFVNWPGDEPQTMWLELVMEDNLLGTAEANGKMQLTSIFMAFGFKHVNIGFVADTTVCDTTAIVGDSVSGNATTLFSK